VRGSRRVGRDLVVPPPGTQCWAGLRELLIASQLCPDRDRRIPKNGARILIVVRDAQSGCCPSIDGN
jgi:hypothetical protein